MMKGILLGQEAVLLLVFAIQTAMKCHATFCNDRYDSLLHDICNHNRRCLHSDNKGPSCCEAEESSLKERIQNHIILCDERVIFGKWETIYPGHSVPPSLYNLNLFTASNLTSYFRPCIHFI